MNYCQKCGAAMNEADKFCMTCGEKSIYELAGPAEQKIVGYSIQGVLNLSGEPVSPQDYKFSILGTFLGILTILIGIGLDLLYFTRVEIEIVDFYIIYMVTVLIVLVIIGILELAASSSLRNNERPVSAIFCVSGIILDLLGITTLIIVADWNSAYIFLSVVIIVIAITNLIIWWKTKEQSYQMIAEGPEVRLIELQELRGKGLINEGEYNEIRRKILGI
jgi:hypothetical protein